MSCRLCGRLVSREGLCRPHYLEQDGVLDQRVYDKSKAIVYLTTDERRTITHMANLGAEDIEIAVRLNLNLNTVRGYRSGRLR